MVNRAELAECTLGISDRVIVPGISVETGDCLHLGVAKVKVEDRDVLDEAFKSGGLGDGDGASLDGPSEEDLGWCLIVSSSNIRHNLFGKQGLFIGG